MMQAVIALPGADEIQANGGDEQSLRRKVCGIPLLTRVIATAQRSGVTEVLLLRPENLPESWLEGCLDSPLLSSVSLERLTVGQRFDSNKESDWHAIADRLHPKFLWLPWNNIVEKKLLGQLVGAGRNSENGVRFGWTDFETPPRSKVPDFSRTTGADDPVVCVKGKMQMGVNGSPQPEEGRGPLHRYLASPAMEVISIPRPPGDLVASLKGYQDAERRLVRRSGKDSDGIYSKFNRWLSRPAVRAFSKTGITPNQVTFAGLFIALLSGWAFAQGHWTGYVLGAVLYFASVLFDEIDGMLARITFRESSFGCWLETFVDYATYVLLFAGMTVGLYRQSGTTWLVMGGLLLLGLLLSFLVLAKQRKLATDPGRPQEYRQRLHRRLEADADAGNIFSWFVRRVEFFVRKPAICHYVLLFSLLGGLKILFVLAALGANLVWLFVLSFNRLFRRPDFHSAAMEEAKQT